MQVIDAGMVAFAAFHALRGRIEWPLTFQVPRMLRAMVREAEDAYVLAWNAERLRKREMWPAYRDRPEIWDEAGQDDFDAMLEALTALGVVQFRTDGWEADEVIAALVHRFEGTEEIVIRSDDKDFMQLLSGSTWMDGRVRGEVRFSDVKEILGVTPAYVADFLALAGDEADGIPRIVTPSRARELIRSRGHVRDWIDRDLRVAPSLAEKVEEGREQLRLNLALVDLSRDAVGEVPAPILDGWDDPERARAIGERTDVTWLADADVADEYAVLRERGAAARRRLEV